MTLAHVTDISTYYSHVELIEKNIISFFDYEFVNLGGHIDVSLGAESCYSSDFSQLRKVEDSRFSGNEVWEGVENWVFENNDQIEVGTVFTAPTIEIDGSVAAPVSIDYINGRVIVSPGASTVRAQYSYKWVLFTDSRKSLNPLYFNPYDKRPDLVKSGNRNNAEIEVPLPVFSLSSPTSVNSNFYGIAKHWDQKVIKYKASADIFAETHLEAHKISDIILSQKGYYFTGFCWREVCLNDQEPLNLNGTLKSGKSFQQLSDDYPWRDIFFKDISVKSGKYIAPKLYRLTIDFNVECVICGQEC